MASFQQKIWQKTKCILVALIVLFAGTGCSSIFLFSSPQSRTRINEKSVEQIENQPTKTNNLKILVIVGTQMGELLWNGESVATFPVSTGKQGHSTPYGNFSIYNKEKENTSSLYGSIFDSSGKMIVPYADSRKNKVPKGGRFDGSPMPYTMHFSGYCAFHEGAVPDPPRRASHGCVRLTPDIAELLFRLCPVGTPVIVMY